MGRTRTHKSLQAPMNFLWLLQSGGKGRALNGSPRRQSPGKGFVWDPALPERSSGPALLLELPKRPVLGPVPKGMETHSTGAHPIGNGNPFHRECKPPQLPPLPDTTGLETATEKAGLITQTSAWLNNQTPTWFTHQIPTWLNNQTPNLA